MAAYLRSLPTQGCGVREVRCEGGEPVELRLDVTELRNKAARRWLHLRDDLGLEAEG